MKKWIPYEKLSKKEKRKEDLRRRGSWQGVNPVTRKSEDRKKYNRIHSQSWKKEDFMIGNFLLHYTELFDKKISQV